MATEWGKDSFGPITFAYRNIDFECWVVANAQAIIILWKWRTWKSTLCSFISSKHFLTLKKLGPDVVAYTSKNACAVAIERRRIAGNCWSPDVSKISTYWKICTFKFNFQSEMCKLWLPTIHNNRFVAILLQQCTYYYYTFNTKQ